MARLIILGPQCSGKTTIAQRLNGYASTIPILDEDDELSRLNGGESPSDWTGWNYKWEKLRPRVQKSILEMNTVVFFTSFFDPKLLSFAKQKGFKVLQLVTQMDELQKRNKKRVEDGVDDATYGWKLNMPYHEGLRKSGVVDLFVSTDKPAEEVARLIFIIVRITMLSQYAPQARRTSVVSGKNKR